MLKDILAKTAGGAHLTEQEAAAAMETIMQGNATPAQIGAFLTALQIKNVNEDEVTGFARAMRKQAARVNYCSTLIDTCGTGGDGTHTFNISTAAALVLAGAGMKVAKHGNRSVSSYCGSADVLEELGINLNLNIENLQHCLEETGIAFLYAPALHQAMKHAAGPRRELGFRTVFNMLGPLTNPAGAELQVMGVYHRELTYLLAKVLARLNTKRAFVVHGDGGLDEISPSGPAKICEVNYREVKSYTLDPLEYSIPRHPVYELTGGTPRENAEIIIKVLNGEKGAQRDTVLLNAAPGLIAGDKAKNFQEGIQIASEIIDSGKASNKLQELAAFTKKHGERQVSGL
ncbi:MAG: anthranilate phosphoribosyltransferase [Clostridiales bacterium]|nr:anthranilate phosphoribosyltransferase [Clostridiales bacterium]MCF8023431.1 anthranilate phosphoribosyltransferase [Clostridiales bacterium]